MRLNIFLGLLVLGCATSGAGAAQANPKPRLLVLTDIGGDPDDQQSMVRLMTYSNEFDIEGLVATSRMGHGLDVQPQLIQEIVAAYGQVRASLLLHKTGYPTSSALLGVIKRGNPVAGTGSVGAGKDTEGSNWIIGVVDEADSRPLNVSIWGGATDLAQALWRVRNDRTSSQLAAFLAKLRVHSIGDQDNSSPWIRQQFPTLWYIHDLYEADKFQSPYRGMYLGGDVSIRSGSWVTSNVRSGHGALGALYPATAPGSDGVKEGDTPSWFYFLPKGMNSPEQPTWGGWGGRFSGVGPLYLSNALDTVGSETSRRATVWRWRPAFQNDFQARMDWCVQPFGGANHNPTASVVGGAVRTVATGSTVVLDASGSADPDGHGLSYAWRPYREPSTAAVSISNSTSRIASFIAPSTSSVIHVLLEVKDNGTPPLSDFRRVVITVDAQSSALPSATISQPASDGQTFSSTLSFAGQGSAGTSLGWYIDRIGDGLAAAKLAASGTSGSQALSGSIGGVQLDVAGSDYDLILRATNAQGAFAEAKRRYRYVSTSTFSITVNSVSTGKGYSTAAAKTGALPYVDRSYAVTATPAGTLIRTSNDDKNVSAASHLTFTMSGPATVCVAYDRRATTAPPWLAGWTVTADVFSTSDAPASPMRVYSKSFPAGTVTLGGNLAGGLTGAQSHYVVLIKAGVVAAARTLEEDAWEHPGDSDGDGLMDGFELAQVTDPNQVDTDGDGDPDETELDALGKTLWEVQEGAGEDAEDGEDGRCGLFGLEFLALFALRLRRCNRALRQLSCIGLLLLSALALDAQSTGVPVWTRWEASLASSRTYANPYADVSVSVSYTGPSSFSSHAFWDGGSSFKIRAAFPAAGTWTWRTTCSDTGNSGLHDRSGTVSVVAYAGTNVLYQRGFLKTSADKRYLTFNDGSPFKWIGDTAWIAPLRASTSDWAAYLDDRAAKRFTMIQISPASSWGGTADVAGNTPFTGSGLAKWNPAYWQGLEQKVEAANQKGLVVFLNGIMEPVSRYPTSAEATLFARNIAARLQGNHLIFSPSFDSPYSALGDAVGNALNAATSRHLITQHPGTDIVASRTYYDKGYLDFCGVQSGHNGGNRETCANRAIAWNLEMYARNPWKPVLNLEAFYDANGTAPTLGGAYQGTAKDARQLGWLSWLSGSLGYTYGAYGIWNWERNASTSYHWSKAIAYPSSTHMKHMSDFLGSIAWWRLAPAHALVQGNPSAYLSKRVLARSSNGDLAVAYSPDANAITLSMTSFIGAMKARWFNPTSGAYTDVAGTHANSGTTSFTPPASGDWVLLLTPGTSTSPAAITQPAVDGQSFTAGSTLSFAGSAASPRTWLIDRIGDGLAAVPLAATGTSGSQVLSGSIGAVPLDLVGVDYELVLRGADGSEARRRYRVTSGAAFTVAIQSVSTGRPYALSTAAAGALYYIDRSYTIGSSTLSGTLIRTSNDDKNVSAASHLTFSVSGAATVYVGYDRRATTAPSWLGGWTLTGDVLQVSDGFASPMRVYRKDVAAGPVTLGGNQAGGPTGAQSHYVVVVKGPSTPAAKSIAADAWEHAGDGDGDGLQDAFELAKGTDPALADTDGDGDPDEAELDSLGKTLWEVQEAGSSAPADEGSSSSNCGLLGAEILLLLALLRRR